MKNLDHVVLQAAEQAKQVTDDTRVAWTSLGTVKAMLPELLASDDVKVRENAQIIDALVKLVGCQQQAGHIGDANKMVQAAPAGWRGVIPGRRRTDNWDSARVADFNNGWNACQHAVKSALAELEGRPE